ncbi:MAG: ATP-binding protein [Persicimonas sp.]
MSYRRPSDDVELEETLESLRDKCRQKDRFIATLAHELRNPITALRAAVHLQELSDDDAQLRQKTFEIIARQTEHMERLIDDLMELSRLNRGTINLDRQVIDLTSVVAQFLVDQQATFESRDIELRAEFERNPLWIDADITSITQVLGNLLDNARNACAPGDRVTVKVDGDDARRQAVIAVCDIGVGMDDEQVDGIFDDFSQIDHSANYQGGLGLGLAIVRGLVELHGGVVDGHNDGEGRGSTFVVRLPLSEEPPEVTAGEPSSEIYDARRILLVEDEPDVAHLLAQLLELDGHEVRLAHDVQEAIGALDERVPDAILCSLQLSGELDGYDLCSAVSVDPRFESVRMVAMTGRGGEELRERSLDSGFDEHLTKPVDLDELCRAMRGSGE